MNIVIELLTTLDRSDFLLFAFICKSLWLRRNLAIREDIFIPSYSVYQQALQAHDNFKQALALQGHVSTNTTDVPIHWNPPPHSLLKVNWDVISNSNTNRIGMSVIVRDSTKSSLCKSSKAYVFQCWLHFNISARFYSSSKILFWFGSTCCSIWRSFCNSCSSCFNQVLSLTVDRLINWILLSCSISCLVYYLWS